MTSSTLTEVLNSLQAPKTEAVLEEVVVKKEASVDNLIYGLVSYASFTYQLNTQAHLIHINIESPIFLSIHEFLKEQYEQHITDFDTISELVRSMDYLLPTCQCGLMDAYKKFKSVKTYDAKESLTIYLKNLELAGYTAKELVDLAREVGAPDVENELATVVNHCFKSAWMLKATLRTVSSI